MFQRTLLHSVTFRGSFRIEGVGSIVPAGTYLIETNEESISGNFPLTYRRVRTMITIEIKGSWQVLVIDPQDLEVALRRDMDAAGSNQYQG